MATTARPAFSWTDALAGLRRPGPPPPGLLRMAVRLLAACAIAIGVLTWLGHRRGVPHHYFREWQAGTFLSVGVLVASGLLCALIGWRLRRTSFARFWWLTAPAFIYLGLDDLLSMHEGIDFLLHKRFGLDPRDPVTRHGDDLIVALYGVLALVFAYTYRAELARLRWMVLSLGVAFVPFATMVVFDLMNWPQAVEDSLKLLAGTLIFIGFYAGSLQLRQEPALTIGAPSAC